MHGNGSDEKPNFESRIGDIEAIERLMLNDHQEFRQEHKRLLTAQVLLADARRESEKKIAELAAAQARSEKSSEELREAGKRVDGRMETLGIAIGDLIRRMPQPAQS